LPPPENGIFQVREHLGGYWKLRVGDYRVVFKVVGEWVYVLGIHHWKSVYEDVTGRIK
jgi:mRNA interferase RelE/StbE